MFLWITLVSLAKPCGQGFRTDCVLFTVCQTCMQCKYLRDVPLDFFFFKWMHLFVTVIGERAEKCFCTLAFGFLQFWYSWLTCNNKECTCDGQTNCNKSFIVFCETTWSRKRNSCEMLPQVANMAQPSCVAWCFLMKGCHPCSMDAF